MTETETNVHPKVLEALESGEYSQTRGNLAKLDNSAKGGRRYCIQGLLCEIYRQETGKGEWLTSEELVERDIASHVFIDNKRELFFVVERERLRDFEDPNKKYYRRSSTTAPDEVLTWSGVSTEGYNIGTEGNPIYKNVRLSRPVRELVNRIRKVAYSYSGLVGLITLNDDYRVKFASIAKFLREIKPYTVKP